MITYEQIEMKFFFKNEIVVYSPNDIPIKVRRDKKYKVSVEYKNHKTLLEDAEDLENYLKIVSVKKDTNNLYSAHELNNLLKNNKELYFSNTVHEYKVTKKFYYYYTLDNKDTQITFDSTEKLVDFLNRHKFTV